MLPLRGCLLSPPLGSRLPNPTYVLFYSLYNTCQYWKIGLLILCFYSIISPSPEFFLYALFFPLFKYSTPIPLLPQRQTFQCTNFVSFHLYVFLQIILCIFLIYAKSIVLYIYISHISFIFLLDTIYLRYIIFSL